MFITRMSRQRLRVSLAVCSNKMKYFELSEVVLSIAYAILYGAFGGLVSRAVRVILEDINRLLFLFPISYSSAYPFSIKALKRRAKGLSSKCAPFAVYTVLDALFFLIFGIGFFILSYYANDGQIRFYMVAAVFLSFLISERNLGRMFERAFRAVYNKAYFIFLVFLSLALLPIKLSFSIINRRLIVPVARRFRLLCRKKMHAIIVNKKLKEAKNMAFVYEISPKNPAKQQKNEP